MSRSGISRPQAVGYVSLGPATAADGAAREATLEVKAGCATSGGGAELLYGGIRVGSREEHCNGIL